MTTILITGGAGYIGSHIGFLLAQCGYRIIVLDAYFHQQQFNPGWATIIEADYADTDVLDEIFTQYRIETVVHCAASTEVGISVKDPLQFYENNVAKTVTLLQSMRKHSVGKVIFSSSCAVYGIPEYLPLTEDHPKRPVSPYGRTKLMIEEIFQDVAQAHGLQYVCLRYFNAAGALPEHGLGEQHVPETHLIPLLLRAALEAKPFTIFGGDYPTPDGTAIRDFLHVADIADAHVKALAYLQAGGASIACNLGTGTGCSVQEMVTLTQKVCKKKITIVRAERRPGDPPTLVADPALARRVLGWSAQHSDLAYILASAYAFMQKRGTDETPTCHPAALDELLCNERRG